MQKSLERDALGGEGNSAFGAGRKRTDLALAQDDSKPQPKFAACSFAQEPPSPTREKVGAGGEEQKGLVCAKGGKRPLLLHISRADNEAIRSRAVAL